MTTTRVGSYEEIAEAFQARVREVIWCGASTVDSRGRPRSRVLHPLWEGPVGWVTTRRGSPKIRHLAANRHMSLAFVADPFRPLYVECYAAWDGDLATRERIWDLARATPQEYGGFDPAETWGDIEDPENGLIRLSPWRIEVNDFRPPPRTMVWRAAEE